MDLNTIANFAVAIGTLAMAYYSYKNIRNSDKQLKFLKKQTDLFLSQQQPDIQITSFSFDVNELKLDLKNSGGGSAYDIAVSCAFNITKPLWWSKKGILVPVISEPRTQSEIINVEEPKIFFSNIFFKPSKKNVLEIATSIVYPHSDLFSNSLPEKFGVTPFHCEPLFQLKTKKEKFREIPPYLAKAIPFAELRTLLIDNNIKEISVIFSLWSKDKLQNVLSHGKICDFVINLLDNESLEIALKRGKPGPYPFDKKEIKTKLKWEDFDHYYFGKY